MSRHPSAEGARRARGALALTLAGFGAPLVAGTTLTPLMLPDGACDMDPVSRGAFAGDAEPVFNATFVPRFDDCRFGVGDGRAYRWNGADWQDVGPAGGFNRADGVHPSGRVVGSFTDAGAGGRSAFAWAAATGPLVLPRSGDAASAFARAVNADGTAVGYERSATDPDVRFATAWPPGGGPVRLLESFDPAPYAVFRSEATAIGDAGAIGGEWRRYAPDPDDDYAEADSVGRVFRLDGVGESVEDIFGVGIREPLLEVFAVGDPWQVIFGDLRYDELAWAGNPPGDDIEPVRIDGSVRVLLRDANRHGRSVYEVNGGTWLREPNGDVVALPGPEGSTGTEVSDLADTGQAVGSASLVDGSRRAVSWTADGAVRDLNDALPDDAPAGLLLVRASSVSETGVVAVQDAEGGWWLLAEEDGPATGDDGDGDGVADALDVCPGTVLGVEPSVGATKSRFYGTTGGVFADGRGTVSAVTVADAGGCSGQQIIAALRLSDSNLRYGLWGHELDRWAAGLAALGGTATDEDGDGVGDADDVCPGTVLGTEPTVRLTKGRYYSTAAGLFVDGRGTVSAVKVKDAGGCSGQQIIEAADHGSSNERYGLWGHLLVDWAMEVDER